MKFKTVEHATREEWLQWRHNGIGSSDVPVIMGVSRYKKYHQLLVEKSQLVVSEDQSNSFIKDRGNRIETAVRDFYTQKMGLVFKPLSCQDSENLHRLATLDGIDEGYNLFIEIKLLSSQKEGQENTKTQGYQKWQDAKKYEAVPVDYYPQIQHQLSVTGATAAVFIGLKEVRKPGYPPAPITDDDLAIVSVLPDELYIKKMNSKIDEFWNQVLKKRRENENTNATKS